MSHYKLWAVYIPQLEQWVRETGARIEASFDNEDHDLEVEYINFNDPRISLYGWENVPIFAAVKYNQPFRTVVGKQTWETYDAWIRELNWKINE